MTLPCLLPLDDTQREIKFQLLDTLERRRRHVSQKVSDPRQRDIRPRCILVTPPEMRAARTQCCDSSTRDLPNNPDSALWRCLLILHTCQEKQYGFLFFAS
ncbi:hypothetical protein CDAR_175521 [Caerostris darwini]|uniref:Uncharacterized protein n=1 Tax=Caerostris darwini TaxID=1538125 RepID=A0AAV4RWC1_9ARAC|nr:hypothetical protein CDAR_175521 [Caerostris darwini]